MSTAKQDIALLKRKRRAPPNTLQPAFARSFPLASYIRLMGDNEADTLTAVTSHIMAVLITVAMGMPVLDEGNLIKQVGKNV